VLGVFLTATPFGAFGPATGADEPTPAKRAEDKQEVVALTAVNEKGKATVFSAAALAKLPRQPLKTKDPSGTPATYEGVSLAEVLRAAGVALGNDLRGPLLANCLVVQAADGYRVVFSLPEIDPDTTDRLVLLADRKDGKALGAKEGPYRLVVPHDKRHARWVRQVTRISVQAAAEIGTDKKGGKDEPKPAPAR
jgi:DMSO/TMAO reductase YedYZ molybdopterin-dependent catalytic subunit